MEFIYLNAKNEIKIQHIENVSLSDGHYQGICFASGHLKTFRKVRALEMLSGKENAKKRLNYHLLNAPPAKESQARITNKSGEAEICFTGFKKDEKEKLISLAEKNIMHIRSSVTKKLGFLYCGYNAGPTKTKNAQHQGVVILTE